ncbi:uncharacterized protein LOC114533865 [Dendronephthya gigantea]|uniref:uncharacterized protein LOC114533865 n=1 Tax=Dendronephthya gigantea TaxID=151771 RepID=UPI00106939BA|nr:uncharacterized protein LOC114533865 [Dendronephthya gigantea]
MVNGVWKMLQKRRRVVIAAAGVILVVSLTLFTTGIVFILHKRCEKSGESSTSTLDLCGRSDEGERSGLIDLFANARRTYSKVSPFSTLSVSRLTPREEFLKPSSIKNCTDSARSLYKQFKSLQINTHKLTPRELKSIAELEHFLNHNFAQPGSDYYSGLWLLGPDIMCTDYMCRHFSGQVLSTGAMHFRPKTVEDILEVRNALAFYNRTIRQYIENIRYGARSGMVRSVEACLAGLDAIKERFINIAHRNATGILQEWFVHLMLIPAYYEDLHEETKEKWFKTYGKNVNESIKDFLVELIGKPLEEMLRFLEHENILNCVPSSVSSGLANLPLSYIYFNGSKTETPTHPYLPSGEKLDGRKAYENLLASYTTTNLTADEVHALGWKHVNILYSQILELAKNVTGHTNESYVIEDFKSLLTNRSQYYNEQSFPKNESFETARKNCRNADSARRFCPKRWEALQLWFDEEARLLSQLDPKTCNLFHFTGLKRTTPNCPIQLVPNFNPSIAAASYFYSSGCTGPAFIKLPFFNDDYGPRYLGMTINAHEGRPGHHTQRQGYFENFQNSCPVNEMGWLDKIMLSKYGAFTEGWGLYAEYPLVAEYTDAYTNQPLSRYGMLKGQILRALRLVVDAGFHYKKMKRDEALDLFRKYMWDTSDVMEKEVTRYQSVPGQASSYKIGQLTILDLQKYMRDELAEKFSIRDFHYELLRHGSVPLHYIKGQVEKYVNCQKNNEDCQYSKTTLSKLVQKSHDSSRSEFDMNQMFNVERYY